jgi:hypothetical protein
MGRDVDIKRSEFHEEDDDVDRVDEEGVIKLFHSLRTSLDPGKRRG